MRVLIPNVKNTIKVPLRDYSTNDNYNVILFNENTTQETEFTIEDESVESIQANNNQLEFELDIPSVEGSVFSYKVLDNANNNVLFRGKLFFTSQVPQNYNING